MTKTIIKRDGKVVTFDKQRIERAIEACFNSLNKPANGLSSKLTDQVCNVITAQYHQTTPTVEGVQDIVEMVLQSAGEYDAAKHYILYRNEKTKLRKERPVPDDIRQRFKESAKYFPTPLQQFQFYDKYSRYDYQLSRRETWVETVNRAVSYLRELSQNALSPQIYDTIQTSILTMQAMPSMRLLAMAGPAARRQNLAIYNCSYLAVDSLDSFVEALIISMAGCGVGYSVERSNVEWLPRIQRQTNGLLPKFVIPDTSEGWAEALRLGLDCWFDGRDVQFDYSQIRPAGSPLKTKGGRASGPEPLRKTLTFIRDKVLSRQGGFLRPLDAHDIMCVIGNAAVSGGVRRTAMISLFDFDDTEMLRCKDGDFERHNNQRWNANNSAVWPSGQLSQEQVANFVLSMVASGRGEPGIFNRQAAIDTKPLRRQGAEFGTNPCVTGDTWVMTEQGPRRVTDLIGRPFVALVDGEPYPSTEAGFFKSGYKDIYLLETVEGYSLKLTADHPVLTVAGQLAEWVPASELEPGDLIRLHNHRGISWNAKDDGNEVAWLLGMLVGNGTFYTRDGDNRNNQALLRFWENTGAAMAKMSHLALTSNIKTRSDMRPSFNPQGEYWQLSSTGLARVAEGYGIAPGNKTVTSSIEQTSRGFYIGFLRGLFDADGSVIGEQKKGVSIRLSQSDLGLLQAVQRMLLRLGIVSTIYQERRPAGFRLLPDGHGGKKEYWNKAQHELVISRDNLIFYQDIIGFFKPDKMSRLKKLIGQYKRKPNREQFTARIKSIVHIGQDTVYDCSIPGINAFDANGFYVHNCGEINLRNQQLCNLSIAVARPDDTYETLKEKVEVATVIGTIQSMATFFPGLREEWSRNCIRERLLGVDITGQMDSPVAQNSEVMSRLKQVAIDTNIEISNKLGINPSASITCVKPSGNSSQLLNCSAGLHPRWSPYYIRNVRVSSHSPIYKVLRDAGVPMSPENGQLPDTADTWVIHFPVKSPPGATVRKDRDAIEQCDYWLRNKLFWTEHNPSVTITYQPDEVIDLMKWIWRHQDKIGGMAFLPASDAQYDQMPYVEISEDEYNRLAGKFPQIDFSKLYRYETYDQTTAAQELACLAGQCEI